MILSCVIVEDLAIAAAYLKSCCERNGQIRVTGIYGTVQEALVSLRAHPADIVFLDVEMPDANGFVLLDQLNYHPKVILTTGKKEYAYDAFEHHVTDFLKKPFTYQRFEEAIKKVMGTFHYGPAAADHIFVKVNGSLIRLPLNEILYVESVGDYVRFVTAKNKYLSHHTIKGIFAELPATDFVKIHRSYIVNKQAVTAIKEQSILIDERELPVSKANRAVVKKLISGK